MILRSIEAGGQNLFVGLEMRMGSNRTYFPPTRTPK